MGFEQGFSDVERAARALEDAAKGLLQVARQLERAAMEGDTRKIRRAAESIAPKLALARQAGSNAESSWPYTEDEERDYLDTEYAGELRRASAEADLSMHAVDEGLVAFPSIIRVAPKDAAVRINRKRVSSLRPSFLIKLLKAAQGRPPRFKADQFLESLYGAYDVLAKSAGDTVLLVNVYRLLTLQPGAANEYTREEFARDLYALTHSNVACTKKGFRAHWIQASSGATARGLPFVSPDGRPETYYGIAFEEER